MVRVYDGGWAKAAGLNVELASQDLLEAVEDDQGQDLPRSNSPELMEMEEGDESFKIWSGATEKTAGNTSVEKSFDDNVDDLLEGMSDDEPPVTASLKQSTTSQAPSAG